MKYSCPNCRSAVIGMLGENERKQVITVTAAVALSTFIGLFVLNSGLATDFVVFWAAQQVSNGYDVSELRSAIVDTIGEARTPDTPWPFPYPPTFLLITVWIKPLSLEAAYSAWLALSGGALVAATRHPASPALLLSPWVIFALMAGQTAILLGALILGAVSHLNRPGWAGLFLGIAACIKPQFVFLVGCGLLFAGEWRTIFVTLAASLLLILSTIAVYGLDLWLDWFELLPKMFVYTEQIRYHLDLPGWPLKFIALIIGLGFIWRSFRGDDPAEKAVASMATSLLCTPHALWYNSAILAPALFTLAFRRRFPGNAALLVLIFKPTSLLIIASSLWLLLTTRLTVVPGTIAVPRGGSPTSARG